MARGPIGDSAIAGIVGEEEYNELLQEEAGFYQVPFGAEAEEGSLYSPEQYQALMDAPRVQVFVQDPHDPNADAIWVGYNGMNFNINCGEIIELPEPLAMLLEDSQRSMRIAKKKSHMLIRSMNVRQHLENAHPERRTARH